MLDRFAIFTAFILWLTAHKRYSKIAFVLFLWLLIPDLIHTYLFLEFREANNWVIYQLYNCVNSATICALIKLYSHMLIIYTLAINILLNILISFYFISDNIPILVYNSYSYVAGMLTVIGLMYMRALHYGSRVRQREINNRKFINLVFWSRIFRNKLFLGRDIL